MHDVKIIDDEAVLFENGIEKMNLEPLRKDGEIQYDFPDGSCVNIYSNNTIAWYDSNDNWHRDGDMPAYITTCGYVAYCKHYKPHREFGPAIIWEDGKEEYWLDDIEYTNEEFINKLNSNYGGVYHA